MSGLKSPVLLGLVLLMLSAGYCKERTDSIDLKDRQSLFNLIMEIIQELKRYHMEKDNGVQYFSNHDYTLDRREVADYGEYQDEQRAEIVPRDLRMKDKFLKHLTGPLYFSPKCSKHFHRLYHNTRDCTIPASTYYCKDKCNKKIKHLRFVASEREKTIHCQYKSISSSTVSSALCDLLSVIDFKDQVLYIKKHGYLNCNPGC